MITQGPDHPLPLLEMRHISKSFPGVRALNDVSLRLGRGEVLALVGENGAGKSTLIKVLGGAHLPDSGEVLLEGRPLRLPTPTAAQRAGISIIYQEFNLIADLTVRENIFLGRERTRWGMIRSADEERQVRQLFERIGLGIDPESRCRELTVAQQQKVEIAKALSLEARIVVMDEPTAALGTREVEQLFAVIGELKRLGIGIIYISHRLDEIFAVADRVLVLRDGQQVACEPIARFTRRSLIETMVGRPLESEFPRHAASPGAERLRVEGLCRGDAVREVSFAARAGEILGMAGLAGAGRTETMRLVFGADRLDAGRIFVDGKLARIGNPRDAIRHRICLLTEDRKGQGLVLKHSVRENFGLPNLDRFVRHTLIDERKERVELARYTESLKITLAGQDQPVGNLSGGNQQKVVLAKWLAGRADILIFDEPTRGIDVGAKYEIYLLMNRLVEDGKAVIMISSELPEILGMSDRILVMHEGRVKGQIDSPAGTTQEDILAMAIA
ncbi:MAG: sugar ABC transporter ATP-binding protein [Thermoguttaceae bacterium]